MEDAAVQCGIPIEEVYQYVTDKMSQVDTLNWELRLKGQEALQHALKKLTKLAQGKQRISSQSESMGPGMNSSTGYAADDLEAAKALAKFGIDALKLANIGKAPKEKERDGQPDLFENADPWRLKQPE